MNEKAFSLMIIGIYAFVMSIILFSSFVTPYTAPTIPYNTKTADLNTLKQVSLYRLNDINNTPSFLCLIISLIPPVFDPYRISGLIQVFPSFSTSSHLVYWGLERPL